MLPVVGGRELAEELLDMCAEEVAPENRSELLNMSSPVAGADDAEVEDCREGRWS